MDLFDLEPDEIEVLFYRCRDETPTQIQVRLGISTGEFFNRQNAAFTKLAIPGQAKQKFDNFRRKGLCDIVRQLTKDDIQNWYERREELRKKLLPPSPVTNDPNEKPGRELGEWVDNNRQKIWIAVAGLLFLVFLVAAFLLGRGINPPPPPPTPLPSATQQIPVTETFTTLPTGSPTLAFADTPAPTATPQTPTLAPSDTAIPTTDLLIATFDQGLPNGMELVYGDIDFVNGELVAHDFSLLAIGDDTWENYQIEYDARKHTYCFGLENNGISAHAIGPEDMIMWSWNYCESGWFKFTGRWELIAFDDRNLANPGTVVNIRLAAEGGNFSVYVNSIKHSTYFDDKYLQGKAYLYVSDSSVIDNVRVSQLP